MSTVKSPSKPVLTLRRALWLVFAVAVVGRAAYFVEHLQSPFVDVPILDEAYYDSVARVLAGHATDDSLRFEGDFRPLLYPFLLSFAYRWFESSAGLGVIVVQHLIGTATALGVTVIASRLFAGSAAAGLAAGVMLALAGPVVFYEGEMLNTSLFAASLVVQLVLLAGVGVSRGMWFGSGSWLALATQLRPNALILAVIYPFQALVKRRRGAWFGLLGLGCVLLAVAALEAPVVGKMRFAGGSGAVNFYLGNKIGADGMIPRQDWAVTYGSSYRDSVELFSELEAASSGVSETRYWLRRTIADITSDPLGWLELMGAKVTYLISTAEIPSNRSFEFSRVFESSTLRWMPIQWWMLLAFGTLGAFVAYRRTPDSDILWTILAMLVLLALAILAFFVNSRFRAPLWPLMSILAGGGVCAIIAWLRQREWDRVGRAALIVVLVAALSLAPWVDQRVLSFGRDFFFRSIAHYQYGDLAAADDDVRRSLLLAPHDAAARFQLGTVALAEENNLAAIHSFEIAIELQPGEARIYNNLGIALERVGRVNEAYRSYLASLARAHDYAPALVNAALVELRAGLWQHAERKVEDAKRLGDQSVSLICASAFVAAAKGDHEGAQELLSVANALDSKVTADLVRDHQRRLAIGKVQKPSGNES